MITSIALIAGCVLVGVIISKFADFVYDKHIKRTTKVNTANSEHVRKLLKARYVILYHFADTYSYTLVTLISCNGHVYDITLILILAWMGYHVAFEKFLFCKNEVSHKKDKFSSSPCLLMNICCCHTMTYNNLREG